jgi:DNA-binding NarL/FixJ family response regulator
MKTFIVEDNQLILESLVSTLEELTAVRVVGTAGDEQAALLWLRRPGTECDLLIIDMFLKSGSGFGVLQATGQMATSTRRVVLTNYATAEIRKRCTDLGANRVFDKSSELDALIDYCGRIADGSATAPGELR